MGPDFEKAIHEFSLRMRLFRALQEEKASEGSLTERETLILQQVAEQGPLNISQIAESWPNVSESTISMTITRMWREKRLVSKTINPDNQRVTFVELTDKGRREIDKIRQQRTERFQALFKALQLTDEEKDVLIRVLKRGSNYMDQMLGFNSKDA